MNRILKIFLSVIIIVPITVGILELYLGESFELYRRNPDYGLTILICFMGGIIMAYIVNYTKKGEDE